MKSIAEIGRELNVDLILEGSVRQADARVRVSVLLLRVSDQTHLRADTFEQPRGDVLDLQVEFASQIARAVRTTASNSPARAQTR